MSTDRRGLVTAAQQLLATQPSAPEPAEQLDPDFLGTPAHREESTDATRVPVPERLDTVPESRHLDEPQGRRRRGRDRRTEEWLAYFANRYRSPVENLLAMGDMGIEELCKSLRQCGLQGLELELRCLEFGRIQRAGQLIDRNLPQCTMVSKGDA